MSWTPLLIKGHEMGQLVRGLITCCAPAHRLSWLWEIRSHTGMGMKTSAGGKILEGAEDSGDQGDGWRWILEAHRDLHGWFLWTVVQQELTQLSDQPSWASGVHPVGKGNQDQVSTTLGETVRLRQVGQKLEPCWFLEKPYYSNPPSVAAYCVLPVTGQQSAHEEPMSGNQQAVW